MRITINEALVDEFKMNDFLNENKNLVWAVVNRYCQDKSIEDDLFQIGMIKLYECISEFNISRNIKFSTFAINSIKWEILNAINRKFKIRSNIMYLDKIIDDTNEYHEIIADNRDYFENADFFELKNLIEKVKNSFSSKYINVIDEFLRGKSQKEVEILFNIPHSTVGHIIKQFRNKLAKEIAA